MQAETDAERIVDLGLDKSRVVVSGSIKFDAGSLASSNSLTAEFRERFNISETALLMVAASTHAPEESVVLEALTKIDQPKLRLLVAPRHPERFSEVASLLDRSGLKWCRRTSLPDSSDKDCNVILLDTIGELSSVYALATLVFVGGSIAATGGHNILEPAAVGAAIITGPNTHNFAEITKAFVKAGALLQLQARNNREATTALATAVTELLINDAARRMLQTKARELVEQNRGATERTIRHLEPLLTAPTR
jgi:3-deoxy-D-manno-octulosonic-acid transferase